ncbi:MAG: hypothetical protein JWN86_1887 [Planctomycetota bacterium]|nr:hypothetical protein [Planctomycetota bacterium]
MAGPWQVSELVTRGRLALGHRRPWLDPLADRLLAAFGASRRPTSGRVAEFLVLDAGFLRACKRLSLVTRRRPDIPAVMWPGPGQPSSWAVPPITSTTALADHLGVSPAELEWLADRFERERRSPIDAPRRYVYRWVAKRSGSSRLVEVPGRRLRAVQRRLLREIVDNIPSHDAAHGFRTGRSVRTYIEPHVGRRVVLKLDLLEFFPTITSAWVTALFLVAGYPEPVARLLAGLCTNSVPSLLWDASSAPSKRPEAWRARRLYQRPHLPQGAPTSPALANLIAYRLDVRLAGLAASAGASYTRYADDLAFSGDRDFERSVGRFHIHACAIALEEGFSVNTRKTRIMRQGVRQRVAGVVVNERPNFTRTDFDTLKAILHNCVTHGPHGQDRHGHGDFRAHLLGRISHVASLNPDRGRRLREMFEQVAW